MKQIACAVLALAVSGCGIHFADEPLNRALPQDFTGRDLYDKTDILKYKLNYLVGGVLVCTKAASGENCVLQLEKVVKPNTVVEVTNPKAAIYKSKINAQAATQGSYLAFAANFSASQMAEVTITDTSLVSIKDDDVPVDLIRNYAGAHPKRPGETRWWIQAALLSTILQDDYIQIDSDAKGVVGNTAGISGKVYNSKSSESQDFRISLFRKDIDDPASRASKLSELKAKLSGSLIKSISGLQQLPTAEE